MESGGRNALEFIFIRVAATKVHQTPEAPSLCRVLKMLKSSPVVRTLYQVEDTRAL